MIAFLVEFIKGHSLSTLFAAFVTAALATFSFQHLEIAHLKRSYAQCQAQSTALVHSNQALMDSVSRQNAAIDAWRAASTAKSAASAKALIKAEGEARIYARKAEEWKNKATGTTCASFEALVDDYIRDLQ